MAGPGMRGSPYGATQDFNDFLKSKKEAIRALLPLSRLGTWLYSRRSDRTLYNMKKMKFPILKDTIIDGIPCPAHRYKLE